MITIPSFQVNDNATRVYGDFVEKVAFNVNIDPAMVLGSLTGGYVANSVYNKKKQDALENATPKKSIENGTYAQVENILRDLKIVFTPINVVFSVNGQVFEIIQANEMNPYMRQAFVQKNANYFRDVLMHKINMEIQLAEQAFAQRLLTANGYSGQTKEANYLSKQEYLVKLSEEDFESLVKVASAGLDGITLNLDPTFESLRPFSQSEIFFNPRELQKVAGVFDLFSEDVDEVGIHQLNSQVNVGFLPDRVVFLWNGQLIEQLSLLHMNEQGYQAFLNKDKKFFINLFHQHTKQVAESFEAETPPFPSEEKSGDTHLFNEEELRELPKKAESSEIDETVELIHRLEKSAKSLEEIVDDVVDEEFPVIEREHISPFQDPDIHPLTYDRILTEKYGLKWARHELEAILKQIEVDFDLSEGIAENPMNKISLLHVISNPEHAMFASPLTFEKFIRGVNSKSILFEQFQGNLSLEEIVFGLEIAKAFDGPEVFLQFHSNIEGYVSEELFQQGVRFVSSQLYDESNPSEKNFFKWVNDYLMRKWKETDARGITDQKEIDRQHTMAIQIVEIIEDVITHYAEHIVIDDPYTSIRAILSEENLLESISPEYRKGVENMAVENVVTHLIASIFIEYKQEEFDYILSKLREEGVING